MHRLSLRFLRAALLAALPALAACVAPCDYGQGEVVPVAMRRNLPLVPVEVNGTPVPFVLDTGASRTVILTDGAAALRLQVDRLRTTRGVGIAGETRERNALLARLRFGRHDLRNLTVPVAPRSGPDSLRAAGLLGGDVLGASELDLDLSARRVTLHDRRACRIAALPWPGTPDAIPFEPAPPGMVVIAVEVNGQPLRALFDTGANGTVLRQDLAARIGVTEAALAQLPVETAHGIGTEGVPLRRLEGAVMRVGGETVTGQRLGLMQLPDAPFDVILGQDYIGPRRFWISYAERRLYVRPAATEAPAAPPAPAAR